MSEKAMFSREVWLSRSIPGGDERDASLRERLTLRLVQHAIKYCNAALGYFTGLAGHFLSPPTFLFGLQTLDANGKPKMEIDLCLLFYEHSYSPRPKRIVAVECKAYNRFEPRDLQRLDDFRKRVGDAILVFATLSRHLSKNEKKIISKFVFTLRRLRNKNNNKSNILILTGNELFSNLMKHWWVDDQGYEDKLDALCEQSQVKYLNIKSYQQETMEEIEDIRKIRMAVRLQN